MQETWKFKNETKKLFKNENSSKTPILCGLPKIYEADISKNSIVSGIGSTPHN